MTAVAVTCHSSNHAPVSKPPKVARALRNLFLVGPDKHSVKSEPRRTFFPFDKLPSSRLPLGPPPFLGFQLLVSSILGLPDLDVTLSLGDIILTTTPPAVLRSNASLSFLHFSLLLHGGLNQQYASKPLGYFGIWVQRIRHWTPALCEGGLPVMIAAVLSFIYSFWRTMLDVMRYWRDVRTPPSRPSTRPRY